MKKILFLLSAVFLFASCEKKTPRTLDPTAMIKIREAKQGRSAGGQETPTWEYVVRNADVLVLYNQKYADGAMYRGFHEGQRDLENMALNMFGTDIITQHGELSDEFIGAKDVIFVNGDDTLAYIPNSTLRAAEVKIKNAYEAEDYDEVYRLFDDAYRAIPITGRDYKALKDEGRQ